MGGPTLGDALAAAERIADLERQLAEATGERDRWHRAVHSAEESFQEQYSEIEKRADAAEERLRRVRFALDAFESGRRGPGWMMKELRAATEGGEMTDGQDG